MYSSAVSSNSPIFYWPDGSTDSYYYFQAIQITVATTGTYTFTSNSSIDMIAYFYGTSFDPSDPFTNLITDDDDSGSQLQFRIHVHLQSGSTYILVVTTHRGSVTGSFSVVATGPATIGLASITPSTSRPITTGKYIIRKASIGQSECHIKGRRAHPLHSNYKTHPN